MRARRSMYWLNNFVINCKGGTNKAETQSKMGLNILAHPVVSVRRGTNDCQYAREVGFSAMKQTHCSNFGLQHLLLLHESCSHCAVSVVGVHRTES